MPKKHPSTVRWDGLGASHEDATKPIPKPDPAQPDGAVSTNPRVSTRSGGGGERDEKHSHVDPMRSSKSHATDTIGADAGHLRGGAGWRRMNPRQCIGIGAPLGSDTRPHRITLVSCWRMIAEHHRIWRKR